VLVTGADGRCNWRAAPNRSRSVPDVPVKLCMADLHPGNMGFRGPHSLLRQNREEQNGVHSNSLDGLD
jgi:hypothetical protein